jgi:hypothetical protein
METKDDFIARYCENSKMTREQFDQRYVVMKCNCDDAPAERGIPHWAAIRNLPDHLELHRQSEELLASTPRTG